MELLFINNFAADSGQSSIKGWQSRVKSHIRRRSLTERKSASIDDLIVTYKGREKSFRRAQKRGGPQGYLERWETRRAILRVDVHSTHSDFEPERLPINRLIPRHPYTESAAVASQLPVEQIDALFKSPCFQRAAEPLFSTQLNTAFEMKFRMEDVFPGCLQSLAFMNAILYAVLRSIHKGVATHMAVRLKGRALSWLRRTISSRTASFTHADIGAVLVLRGVAYQWRDDQDYDVHANGLASISEQSCPASYLTPLAERAEFWQRLTAAFVFDRAWQASSSSPSFESSVKPTYFSKPRNPSAILPVGFVRHSDILPEPLLECVGDIMEMCSMRDSTQLSMDTHWRMDNYLASVESRLAPGRVTGHPVNVVDCVRQAAMITCFLNFSQVWANPLVPCRLSVNLLSSMTQSIDDDGWVGRRNLQIWCMLAGAIVTVLDFGAIDGLEPGWERFISRFRSLMRTKDQGDLNACCLDDAMSSFIYCEWWHARAGAIKGWQVLVDDLSSPDKTA